MNINFFNLTRQYEMIKNKIEPKLLEQLASGNYIGGKEVEEFELKFAKYVGVKYAIAVNSGTDALILSLHALGIKKGDEVITTPFTFFATAEAIARVGATPVFVDVEENTYNIDVKQIESKISNKTKAIIPVHLFGQPADMDYICKLKKKYNIAIIEDACQAVGAIIAGKKVGNLGDLGCFSFFPTKNLGAFGDAGIITTNDNNLAILCRAFKEHGMGENGLKAKKLLEGNYTGDEKEFKEEGFYNTAKYFNYLCGYNSRMDAIQAAILNIKLDYLEGFNNRRAEIAAYYNQAFSETSEIRTPELMNDRTHVWHQYVFRCNQKNDLREYLNGKGVGTGAFYPIPLHLQEAFKDLGYRAGSLPTAEKLSNETVCLPIFPEITKEELQYVAECIKEFYVI